MSDDILPPLKRCYKCKEIKPLTEFHRAKKSKDGHDGRCKACIREYGIATAQSRKEYMRQYYIEHQEELKAKQREYNAKNPEKKREYRVKNRERDLAQRRQHRLENLDRIREDGRRRYRENRGVHNERSRQYKSKNPHIFVMAQSRRNARKRGLPDTLTPQDWQRCLDYFNGNCAVCGRPPGLWHKLAQDHWIPLSSPDCPGTTADNIICLCHGDDGCNNSKRNAMPEQWLIRKFGKRKAKAILDKIKAYFEWVKSR